MTERVIEQILVKNLNQPKKLKHLEVEKLDGQTESESPNETDSMAKGLIKYNTVGYYLFQFRGGFTSYVPNGKALTNEEIEEVQAQLNKL